MRITDHSFLIQSFKHDLEKIRQYLYDENIVYVRINEHLKVNSSNYLANFQNYCIHEPTN